MANLAGTITPPEVDGGPEVTSADSVLLAPPPTVTPLIVTDVGSPISSVAGLAEPAGAAGGGTFGRTTCPLTFCPFCPPPAARPTVASFFERGGGCGGLMMGGNGRFAGWVLPNCCGLAGADLAELVVLRKVGRFFICTLDNGQWRPENLGSLGDGIVGRAGTLGMLGKLGRLGRSHSLSLT